MNCKVTDEDRRQWVSEILHTMMEEEEKESEQTKKNVERNAVNGRTGRLTRMHDGFQAIVVSNESKHLFFSDCLGGVVEDGVGGVVWRLRRR
mmetsp:Transcript_2127/g.2329  ORF Transcript_2127/g.2329 Transcript_2127/m.2329 type:complete len:92 (-) Transcript_2127:108-383(-)